MVYFYFISMVFGHSFIWRFFGGICWFLSREIRSKCVQKTSLFTSRFNPIKLFFILHFHVAKLAGFEPLISGSAALSTLPLCCHHWPISYKTLFLLCFLSTNRQLDLNPWSLDQQSWVLYRCAKLAGFEPLISGSVVLSIPPHCYHNWSISFKTLFLLRFQGTNWQLDLNSWSMDQWSWVLYRYAASTGQYLLELFFSSAF